MERYDVIMDMEAFGFDERKCPIIDVSVFCFEWGRFLTNPYSFNELTRGAKRFKLDVKHQVKEYGYSYSKDDLVFWQDQSKEVRAHIAPKDSDLTVPEFGKQMIAYLKDLPDVSYWWSRGNVYEGANLNRLSRDAGFSEELSQILKFWTMRDTRTHIDAKFDYKVRNDFVPIKEEGKWNAMFRKHDSIHDIAADVMRLQAIARAENDLPTVEE